jgi:hypothetical protein
MGITHILNDVPIEEWNREQHAVQPVKKTSVCLESGPGVLLICTSLDETLYQVSQNGETGADHCEKHVV